MKNSYIRGLMLSPVLVILFMIDIHAQSFVYTNNSLIGSNSVTAFSVAANGALTNIGTFATGGSGFTGGLLASNRARTCTVGNRLYVANDGSNSVSGFDINPFTGSLSLVPGSPFATGGLANNGISLDCTPNGNFLIAANGGSNNITVFSIAANGALTPVAGSPFATGGVTPDGIKVTPNGQLLSVAVIDSDAVAMFSIAANGALTPVLGSPFASPAAGVVAGVEINCASSFLYATQANVGGTNVDVFSIGPNGALTLVQTSNNPGVGDNSNAGVLSPNDQFLFVSNQNSDSVTVFDVAGNGTLSLVAGSPFGGAGRAPCGIGTNAAGTFLFTANLNSSTVTSFSIAGNGALTLVGNFSTGQPVAFLTALAVFPGKSCSTFDVCLQDDSNGNLLQFKSTTGDYLFTDCRKGVTLTGAGKVTNDPYGCKIALQDMGPTPKRPDRSVLVQVNRCTRAGTASIRIFSTGSSFSITDGDITNNTCACGASSGEVIYGNFGPGMAFDANPFHGWTVNGFLGPGIGQQAIAHQFTPAVTKTFTGAQVALSLFSGPGNVSVYLQADSNGLPGPVLEQINLTGLTVAPTIFAATSVLRPQLQGGTPYWLTVVAGGSGVLAGWNWNSIGDSSTASNFAGTQGGSPAGPWALNFPGLARSAFQINGSQ